VNYIWGGMILIGIIYASFTGNMQEVTDAALNSSKEAVTLCITMIGVMSLWMGVMEIAKDTGIIQGMSKKIRPLIRFLFPEIPKGHDAEEHITTNIIANDGVIIGLRNQLLWVLLSLIFIRFSISDCLYTSKYGTILL